MLAFFCFKFDFFKQKLLPIIRNWTLSYCKKVCSTIFLSFCMSILWRKNLFRGCGFSARPHFCAGRYHPHSGIHESITLSGGTERQKAMDRIEKIRLVFIQLENYCNFREYYCNIESIFMVWCFYYYDWNQIVKFAHLLCIRYWVCIHIVIININTIFSITTFFIVIIIRIIIIMICFYFFLEL